MIKSFMLPLLLLLMAACTTVRPVQHTLEKKDSVIVREKLVPITIQGTQVSTTLSKEQIDSLVLALKAMPAKDRIIYKNDPTQSTRLSFALDKMSNLIIGCENLEKIYQAKIEEKDRYILQKEIEIREREKSFGQKLSNAINRVIAWGVVAVIILIAAIIFIKRLIP